jgi:glycosyltransferase involved in cell wall biosynthesis
MSTSHAVLKTAPLVSVIMPTFNMGAFIVEALHSLRQQSYQHWELIVVDDAGKDDGTQQEVERFAQQCSKPVTYERLPSNRGVAYARNKAIALSSGEYLAFLDPDDRFEPEKLAIQVEAMTAHRDVVLCHTAVTPQGTLPAVWEDAEIAFQLFARDTTYAACAHKNYLHSNDVCTSSVLCRADLMKEIQFPVGVIQFEDWVAWSECAQKGNFRYINMPLTRYMFHEGGFTSKILGRPNLKNLALLEAQCALLTRIKGARFKLRILRKIGKSVRQCVETTKRQTDDDSQATQASLASETAPGGELTVALAHTFLLFCRRLHKYCTDNNLRHLFFLSREGYHLRQLFDIYQSHYPESERVRSHYLQVSRKSTYLPSLKPLGEESFSRLVDTYQNLSPRSFLISIGLEHCAETVLEAAGISREHYDEVIVGFGSSVEFKQIVACSVFQTVYERERSAQRAALHKYLLSALAEAYGSSSDASKPMTLVDVGWQGSIQDNLVRFCQTTDLRAHSIEGVYLGLLKQRDQKAVARKKGLLFDYSLRGWKPSSRVFNENRALLEVLLHATHGAVGRYSLNEASIAEPVHEPFKESEHIEKYVKRAMASVSKLFARLAKQRSVSSPNLQLERRAIVGHAKLVYQPSERTVHWFEQLKHSENFGAIGKTKFINNAKGWGFLIKLKWTIFYALFRRFPQHSFWPVITMRRRTLWPLADLYTALRLTVARFQAWSLKA